MKRKVWSMILAAAILFSMTGLNVLAEEESRPFAETTEAEAYETESSEGESIQETEEGSTESENGEVQNSETETEEAAEQETETVTEEKTEQETETVTEEAAEQETETADEEEAEQGTETVTEEKTEQETGTVTEEATGQETETVIEEELNQAAKQETETELPGESETEESRQPMTITGFLEIEADQSRIYLAKNRKPDLAELLEMLPGQLEVYLDGGDEPIAMDVSWYCVGEDYETSDGYYFQFSPQWDEEKYVLSASIDLLREAPFVGIFFSDYDDELVRGSVTGRENETTIFEFLVNEIGFNNAGACGVLANIYYESAFNPNALGDNGTSYGICQWHSSRWTAMREWCGSNGYDSTTLIGQLNYLKFELSRNNSSYLWNGKTIYNYIVSVPDTAEGAYDAGYYWCYYFEVPANREQLSVTRGNLAKNTYWAAYRDYVGETVDGWPFRDVKVDPGNWRYDSVKYVYDNHIMNGITKNGTITSFAPDQTLNRAMFATVLYRMAGSPAVTFDNRFSDVEPGQYYSNAVIWAAKNGIVRGLDDGKRFGTNENITREQIAKMLMEYAKLKKYDVSEKANLAAFPDKNAVSGWATEYIRWAVGCGMITGKNTGGVYYLDPQGEATRVECAAMLTRFLKKYQ